MLCDEYRMPAPWSLFAVVAGHRRGEALRDEITRVREDNRSSFVCYIRAFSWAERKAAAEAGIGQRKEEIIETGHYAK
jgi:hypothetical protein